MTAAASPASKRSRGGRRRHHGQGFMTVAGAGWSAVSLLYSAAGAAAQDAVDGAVSVDEGEGESNANSDAAKAVERWLPLFLGLVLVLAVLGWCALNVFRASKLQEAEGGELAAVEKGEGVKKVPGSTSISAAPSRHSSNRQLSLRHPSYRLSRERGGTGDVSPDVVGAIEPQRSLRGSAVSGGQHHHGALTGAGGASLIPELLFKGDELQGKKAPGEQGDVYQNPMQRRPRARGVSTPDTSDATNSSGSGSGRSQRAGDDNGGSCGGSDGDGEVELGQGRRGMGNPFSSSSSASVAGAGQTTLPGSNSNSSSSSSSSRKSETQRSREEGAGRNGSGRSSSGGSSSGRRGDDGDGRGSRVSSGARTGGPDGEGRAYSQGDFARSLPPAVLLAARPIQLNPSSSGV